MVTAVQILSIIDMVYLAELAGLHTPETYWLFVTLYRYRWFQHCNVMTVDGFSQCTIKNGSKKWSQKAILSRLEAVINNICEHNIQEFGQISTVQSEYSYKKHRKMYLIISLVRHINVLLVSVETIG